MDVKKIHLFFLIFLLSFKIYPSDCQEELSYFLKILLKVLATKVLLVELIFSNESNPAYVGKYNNRK